MQERPSQPSSLGAFSKDGWHCDFEDSSQPSASSNGDAAEWKQKLTMLLDDKSNQELISREKKDRRDFEQIAALASKMGLYSHKYAKVVVFSKVPLPDYRHDLDDRRPLREVNVPLTTLRRLDAYVKEYLTQKSRMKESFPDLSVARSSNSNCFGMEEGLFERLKPPTSTNKAVAEKILWQRSLEMRDQQRAWQESPEGRRMLEFRSSLPAYKEKEAILSTISRSQDRSSGWMIGVGCESSGLYVISPSHACTLSTSPLTVHAQLGHPSLPTLKKMVLSLSNLSCLLCESCELRKHTRASFSSVACCL